ncbi:MAG: adenosylcobinamide-GDP ribazoletransferase [Aquabacterium sp.]|nr:adenosylcobinamide-GDP ribazoletransferase [Aquabacterium sp.]
MLRLRHEARLAAVALQFLTRVPVRFRQFDPQWLQDCARHFPLVGAGVGLFGAVVLLAALQVWPAPVAVALAMAATVWLTGGFHEDGLADTCDGLGGAVDRARALLIMKDSRLGSYGALGLLLTLALKAAVLTVLAQRQPLLAAAALVLAHAWSRTGAVALLAWLPYAGEAEHAKAKPLAQHIGPVALAVALAWCALLALLLPWLATWLNGTAGTLPGLSPVRLVLAALAAAGVALWCGRWLRRRLGGFTGDGLGATQQWCELAVYLALAAHHGA